MLLAERLDSLGQRSQDLAFRKGQPSWFRKRLPIVVRSELQSMANFHWAIREGGKESETVNVPGSISRRAVRETQSGGGRGLNGGPNFLSGAGRSCQQKWTTLFHRRSLRAEAAHSMSQTKSRTLTPRASAITFSVPKVMLWRPPSRRYICVRFRPAKAANSSCVNPRCRRSSMILAPTWRSISCKHSSVGCRML